MTKSDTVLRSRAIWTRASFRHVITSLKLRFAVIFLLAMALMVSITTLHYDERVNSFFAGGKFHREPPTILLWHFASHSRRYKNPDGTPIDGKMENNCGGCRFTSNRKSLQESDVILLHESFRSLPWNQAQRKTKIEADIPGVRYPNQLYVFYTKENPYHTKHTVTSIADLEEFDDVFNMTMTYRRDSDIIFPYGCWDSTTAWFETAPLPRKKKVAIMVASDCFRVGGQLRKIYSDELVKAGLPLERYGKCFGNRYTGNITSLIQDFKFFMSFENSFECRDYVSEKFWNKSLGLGVVPIVWGTTREDLENVAPPNSFIHAADFSSPRALTDYLMYLDRNDTAYLQYLKWRDIKHIEQRPICGFTPLSDGTDIPEGFCNLCRKVSAGFRGRVNISQWWYGTENSICLSTDMESLMRYHSEKYGVPLAMNSGG